MITRLRALVHHLRFLADENFDADIIAGVRRHLPGLNVVRAVDVGLRGLPDPDVLEWASQNQRVLLTHDRRTMPAHARARLEQGLSLTGVCIVPMSLPVGAAVQEIWLVAECSDIGDWDGQIRYLPL